MVSSNNNNNNNGQILAGILIGGLAAIGLAGAARADTGGGGNTTTTPQPVSGTILTSKSRGLIFPLYSDAMTQAVITLKSNPKYDNVPVVATINPASGPGDQYTGSTAPRADIQTRINQLNALKNVTVIGYTGSWYAGCLDTPTPTGSQWQGSHFGVVYTQDKSQYSSIIASGGKAIYLPDVVDKYSGVPVNGLVWYTGIKGLFIDEVYNGSNTAKQNWYAQLINYAKSRGLTYFVGNPGAAVPTVYFTGGTFSNLSIREGSGLPLATDLAKVNGNGAYANLSSFSVFNVPSVQQTTINSLIPQAKLMFITQDGADGNPYDNPPVYINSLADWVDQYNRANGVY